MTAGAGDSLSPVAPAGPCADLAEDSEGKPDEQTDYCLIHGLTARRGTEITRRRRSIFSMSVVLSATKRAVASLTALPQNIRCAVT